MKSKIAHIKPSRVPVAVDGLQVNYCKNPACQNFGIPAQEKTTGKAMNDSYTASGGGTSVPVLKCKLCGEFHITQVQLAETLGLSQSAMTAYELGQRRVPASMLPTLAEIFKVPVDELLGKPATTRTGKRGPASKL